MASDLQPSADGLPPRMVRAIDQDGNEVMVNLNDPNIKIQFDGDGGPGPDEPCFCGSGKKFKRCHGQDLA